MNTQIILIIVADFIIGIVAFIIGIVVGSTFKKKPSAKKSEEESIKVMKSENRIILPSEIISFITGKLTEKEENDIVKASKDDKKAAIRIVKMVKTLNDIHRKIIRKRENWNTILPFL